MLVIFNWKANMNFFRKLKLWIPLVILAFRFTLRILSYENCMCWSALRINHVFFNRMKYRFLQVARDRCIKGWKFPEGDFRMEYGSGYPNGKLHKIIRKKCCKIDRSFVMEAISVHLSRSERNHFTLCNKYLPTVAITASVLTLANKY